MTDKTGNHYARYSIGVARIPRTITQLEATAPDNAALRDMARRSGSQPPYDWWDADDDLFSPAGGGGG